MYFFDKKYLMQLNRMEIFPVLYKRYVDDVNMVVKAVALAGGE